jgi:tetratricopeptide (TPR) repeat protein
LKGRARFWLLLLLIAALLQGVVAQAAMAASASTIHDLLVSGYVDKAIQSAQTEIAQSHDDAQVYYLLGRAYYSVKNWDKAIDSLEHATALQPDSSLYELWLGRAYGEKASDVSFLTAVGWAKKARQAFERAVELDPKNVEARSDLTEFYMDAPGMLGGGSDKANEQIQKMAQQDPARAFTFRGRMAEKEKNYAEAEKGFRSAISASGSGPDYWLDLASFYRRRSRWADMEQAVQTAVGLPTAKPAIWFEAAEILQSSGRNLSQAADLLQKYLASEQKDEEAPAFRAHYLLGAILEQQKHPSEAAEQYRAALAMAQEYRPARDALKKMGK